MKLKAIITASALLALAAIFVGVQPRVPPLIAEVTLGATPSTSSPLTVTTTSAAYFVPLGYLRLTCTSPTYYKVGDSTVTATSSDSLAPGPVNVNGVTITRSVWVNITSNQWLALLLRGGVQGTCIVELGSVDGVSGSFTTLAASSTLAVTGATTLTGLVTTGGAIDAGSLNVVGQTTVQGAAVLNSTLATTGASTFASTITSGGVISGTFDGGTAILGATAATSLDLPSSTQLVGVKFGSITLNGASPAVGTATVLTGQKCQCTPEAAADGLTGCAVSSTTLTATGPNGSTGVVNYVCVK